MNTQPEVGSMLRMMDPDGEYQHYEVIEIVSDRLLVRFVDIDENKIYRSSNGDSDFYTEIGPHWEILLRDEWFSMGEQNG